MLNRLLIVVAVVLVLSVATATPTIADHWVGRMDDQAVQISTPIIDIRCDGYAAVWYELAPQFLIPMGINGIDFFLTPENGNMAVRFKGYGLTDGIFWTRQFSDVHTTRFTPIPPGTVVRWDLFVWWQDPHSDADLILGRTSGETVCSQGNLGVDRVVGRIRWHDRYINNAAVKIYDSSVPWQETVSAEGEPGWFNFYIPGYKGQDMWLLICVQEYDYHWVTRFGPIRPNTTLASNGVFSLEIVLDGLSGERVFGGWCDHPIDWSRYN